jgi:alanine-glyoxylate transaminase/serine-glyoxylate transaminase/serine-pyruvate transaminase
VVHNETSTGARTWIEEIRAALDAASHPALLLVDAVSSLAAMDYRHDAWGVDVSISGSQKGLMVPPGLSFNAVSERALLASRQATLPRSYWSWKSMLDQNASGLFPFTPPISLLYGLAESIAMLHEFGLENVFARHERHAEAVRGAATAWRLEIWCRDARSYSPAVTAISMLDGHDADAFRRLVLDRFNVSLAIGLNKLAGKAFGLGTWATPTMPRSSVRWRPSRRGSARPRAALRRWCRCRAQLFSPRGSRFRGPDHRALTCNKAQRLREPFRTSFYLIGEP